jgi:hypothetical protein
MSGPGGISKARGSAGAQAAGHARKLSGENQDKYISYILDSKELSRTDKIEFARRLVELEIAAEAEPLIKQAVRAEEEVSKPKEEVTEKMPAEPKVTPAPVPEQVPSEQMPGCNP